LIAARGAFGIQSGKGLNAALAAGAIGVRMRICQGHEIEERVGRLAMRVECAKPGVESSDRWSRRSDALAAWLLDEWEREKEHRSRRSLVNA